MLRNYLIVALRVLKRNPFLSAINIGGLAIAMAASLIILQYVVYQFSYDRHIPDHENIYRLGFTWQWTDSKGTQEIHVPYVFHEAINKMEKDFPEVERCTWALESPEIGEKIRTEYNKLWITTQPGEQNEPIKTDNFITADSNYFKVFRYDGVPENALKDPDQVVLSGRMAAKLFNSRDVVDEIVYLNGKYAKKITGVYNPPSNTSLKYDVIFSSNHKLIDTNTYSYFFKTREGTDKNSFISNLTEMYPKYHASKLKQFSNVEAFILPVVQPLSDMHFNEFANFEWLKTVTYPSFIFWVLILIAILISTIAMANYFNLTGAQLISRSKEIGMRKVMGAGQSKVLLQYWAESVIVMILAFLIAVTISQVAFPYLNDIGLDYENHYLFKQWWFVPLVIITILITSWITVLTQHYIVNRVSVSRVFTGNINMNSESRSFQRVLLGMQFVCTTGLIIGITVVHQQINHILDQDLGFKSENVIAMDAPKSPGDLNNVEYFLDEIKRIPEVKNVTASNSYPGTMNLTDQYIFYRSSKQRSYGLLTSGPVAPNFIDFYDIEIIAGRNFKKNNPADTNALLISEHSAHRLEFEANEEAINSWVHYSLSSHANDTSKHKEARIIGIFKDYYVNPLHKIEEKKGLTLMLNPDQSRVPHQYFFVKVSVGNTKAVIDDIREKYVSSFSRSAFDYFFIDDKLNANYAKDELLRQVIMIFTLIAIILSCLGLFALTSLLLIRKTKEIGIRKVLGASIKDIFQLFVRGYAGLILVATLVAIPLTWYVAREWLNGYAVRIDLSWEVFVLPVLFLAGLILTLLFLQVQKVSRINPAKSLRDE